jgi:predicted nucleic acid-binding protein
MGLIVLDAGVLIGFLDADDAHHTRAYEALSAAVEASDQLVIPASALAETLVGPSRRGPDAVELVRELVSRLPIEVVPLDERVAVAAAHIRANHRSLKLPDALVIATAQILDASRLVTTDRKWPTQRRLQLKATITVL